MLTMREDGSLYILLTALFISFESVQCVKVEAWLRYSGVKRCWSKKYKS